MSGDVIVTVTLNAALHVAYTAGAPAAEALLAPGGTTPPSPPEGIIPVSRPSYRAGGRGVTVARVLRAFGHDVLAAGLVGGAAVLLLQRGEVRLRVRHLVGDAREKIEEAREKIDEAREKISGAARPSSEHHA